MVKMLLVIRFLYFLFLFNLLVLAQLDDGILLPDLTIDTIDLPIKQLQFNAQTGTTLQCNLLEQRDQKTPLTFQSIQWFVYSFLEQRFIQLDDNELLKTGEYN